MSEELVIGTVTLYKPQRGFGFAETRLPGSNSRVTVFFHKGNARIVSVEYFPEFILTNKLDASVSPTSYGSNPTRIIMRICLGDRGWRARAWGTRPGQDWVYDFLAAKSKTQENTLAWFIGGYLTIDIERSDTITGRIAVVELTPLRLIVKLEDGASHTYDLSRARYRYDGQDVIITLHNKLNQEVSLRFHK
jgi:hypothetical protein